MVFSGANRLRSSVLAAAVAASLSAVLVALRADATIAAAVAAIPAVLVLVSLAVPARRRPVSNDILVDKAAREVGARRKLAIYDPETGLFASWYVALRCEEECYRSERYQVPLSLLLVEPAADSDSWAMQGELADWLTRKRRQSDIAGSLGNGRFLLLMPETNPNQARTVAARLRRAVPGVRAGLSHHLEDGGNFDELREAAMGRLDHASQAAA